MNRTRMLATLATSLALAGLTAGPAAAKGGGGGGGTQPISPPPVFVDPCDGYFDITFPDGSAIVNRTNGGCVIVKSSAGVNRLFQVVLLPGWNYTIESNGAGTSSRVQLAFSNATTGEKAQIRVEFGKTVIS